MPDWVTNPDYKAAVGALTALRKDAGLSQRELASQLGWDHTIIAKIEMGQRNVSVVDFLAWCRVVHADPASVIRQLDQRGASADIVAD